MRTPGEIIGVRGVNRTKRVRVECDALLQCTWTFMSACLFVCLFACLLVCLSVCLCVCVHVYIVWLLWTPAHLRSPFATTTARYHVFGAVLLDNFQSV